MNWKSENIVARNDILHNLDRKVHMIVEKENESDEYLKVLSQNMKKH